MNLRFSDSLKLDFRLRLHKFEECSPSDAQRTRTIQAVRTNAFAIDSDYKHENSSEQKKFESALLDALNTLEVEQYSVTRLQNSSVRVRLDLTHTLEQNDLII